MKTDVLLKTMPVTSNCIIQKQSTQTHCYRLTELVSRFLKQLAITQLSLHVACLALAKHVQEFT